MGLLSKLSAWIAGLLRETETEATTETEEGGAAETGEDSDTEEDVESGTAATLDPGATTETRSAPTDDAVDALRDVRRSKEMSSAEEDIDEPGAAENARSDETTDRSDETTDQASSTSDR